MNFRALAAATNASERELRYAIALGVVPPSDKRGRAADGYGERHVNAVKRYQAFLAIGLAMTDIAELGPEALAPAIVLRADGLELRLTKGATRDTLDETTTSRFLAEAKRRLADRRASSRCTDIVDTKE